ncbi:MAG: 50S ribosomal protein L23 [Deltaproteobacteria bacterium]|nr:50S ribosomal protein L23 [Deltaproteobacteria bacterium]
MTVVAHKILRRPLILTEKGNTMREEANQYSFEVARDATKLEIRAAVEQAFPDVHVVAVRTLIVRGKDRRMGRGYAKLQNWKKAMVTLKDGEKIEFFESF